MNRLLCLSNGHGEDEIAIRILQALQAHPLAPEITALPLVGEGWAYKNNHIPLLAPMQLMPSGGMIYMDGRQLAKDLKQGLLQLLREQIKAIKTWLQQGGDILAVGDIVPLLLGWWSGANYTFVGTAKSDYYWRDEAGPLPNQHCWAGCDYLPWERWLLAQPRCQGVFPRDRLTAETLQQFGIAAVHLGNPMMDGLETSISSDWLQDHPLTILLLPGSRPPEAYANWQQILSGIAGLLQGDQPILFLAAISPGLELEPIVHSLHHHGWRELSQDISLPIAPSTGQSFFQGLNKLWLSNSAFKECLHLADLAISMAGTATEQFVGLGKPVISIPGEGPQFTYRFAEAQTRLLGPSVMLIRQPIQLPGAVAGLIKDPDRLNLIRDNGRHRMGTAGAAQRIADRLLKS
jgi:uncharacterized protein (TIGR03492 family)